jgi:CheY-like chemotaxis protein
MDVSVKKRILCLDDSKDNCDLLSFVLSEAGYEVESAYTLTEGLEIAVGSVFELYLVDLSFSDGDGFELIDKLREIDSSTPIVICSGDTRDSTQERAKHIGVQAFLTKPIDLDLMAKAIVEILNNEPLV